MFKIKWLLLLLLPVIGLGQASRLKAKNFQVESWAGGTRPGYVYLPTDLTKKYPVIVFSHGVTSNPAGFDASSQGPMVWVKKGWDAPYIIIQIKNGVWPLAVEQTKYVVDHDPDIQKYGNGQVMITGLSGGGQRVIEYMNAYNGPNVGFVSMSPSDAPVPPSGTFKLWNFVGNNDRTVPSSLKILTEIKNKYGGKLTVYNGTHCCWDNYYNPAYRENGQNIYEYIFGSGVTTGTPTIPVIPTIPVLKDSLIIIHTLSDSTKIKAVYKLVNGVYQWQAN